MIRLNSWKANILYSLKVKRNSELSLNSGLLSGFRLFENAFFFNDPLIYRINKKVDSQVWVYGFTPDIEK